MPYFDRIFECNTGQYIGVVYHPDGREMSLLSKEKLRTGITGSGDLDSFCDVLSVKIVKEIEL